MAVINPGRELSLGYSFVPHCPFSGDDPGKKTIAEKKESRSLLLGSDDNHPIGTLHAISCCFLP
jgi:hypothetical protein